MSEIAEDLRGEYEAAAQYRFKDGVRTGFIRTMQLIERISRAEARVAELEALAPRWRKEGFDITHWETCWQEHRLCALDRIARMQAENAELRAQVTELNSQNKRLSDELEAANGNHRKMAAEMAELGEENKRLRDALVRLRDCDWVISLPDRMDAVREIARTALEPFPREEAKP